MSDSIEATVQKLITGGHGPFAVARSNDERGLNITFSLFSTVWQEKTLPEPGSIVILSELSSKRAGWRAGKSRFKKPSDL